MGTSSNLIASYVVPVQPVLSKAEGSVQTPQSGLLHCTPHGEPACAYAKATATRVPLVWLPGTTPALTGLSPIGRHMLADGEAFGTLNFMSYIHHSRGTQWVNEHGDGTLQINTTALGSKT